MRDSLSRINTLIIRNLKEILREPLSIIFTIGLPLVMEVLFYLIFHNITSQFEMRYLVPGIVVFSQSFLTLFVGQLIACDRQTSFLTRLYVSKTKSYEFIFAYALSIIPLVLVQSILFFLVGIIFDFKIFGIGMFLSILLSLITSLFFIAVGLLLGTLCNEKSIGGISSIIISCQSILSGMWFPLEGISKSMITFMNVLPFRNATKLISNTLNGINNGFKDFTLPLLNVLVYTLVAFVLAIGMFRKKMKSN